MSNNRTKDRYGKVFQSSIEDNFTFFKSIRTLQELYIKGVPLENNQGLLVPVCELHAEDEKLIHLLGRWRSENDIAYPTRFSVTFKGTRKWLREQVLDNPARILFLIMDEFGRPVGHLGYASCQNDAGLMEIDNVVRGEKDATPGIMANAMRTIISWAEATFLPKEIYLRVLQDNPHAIKFYEKLSFSVESKEPLERIADPGSVRFVPIEQGTYKEADNYFVRMVYAPEKKHDNSAMILTAGPSITAKECAYAFDAAKNGWNNNWNYYLKKFESEFAEYLGVNHALSTSCCTGALHMALLALGIGHGDEVIVPDLTWVASANAVVYTGATPVFADIEVETWCLDPSAFESKITDKTRAVIPVHLYGHPARMDQITEIARKHNLFIVEDAAPSIGAEFKGQKTGTFGDFAAFSFQGAKLSVTGEGGMLVTDNQDLFKKVSKIADQGRVPGTFWIDEIGWKYKMSNIQAALGLAQLERVEDLVEAKRRVFSWYHEGLQDCPEVKLNTEDPDARSIYWMTSITLDHKFPKSRDELISFLKEKNIDTRPLFPAISQYPIWPVQQEPAPVAHRIGSTSINLPSGVCLTEAQVDYVTSCILDFING